jgi:CubicO group peptidase (beta-lactamase class C family)
MPAPLSSHGTNDPAFRGVREVFEELLATREIGAGVAVWVDGREVVDLWGGFAGPTRSRPWERDTLVNLYSTTKGMTAIVAHRLVDSGALDLDAPVARYWPEFAAAGKEAVPVRQLLNHRVGLPAVRELLPAELLFDWAGMTRALAAEAPWWSPGSRHGYHAFTFGWLVGEVVRRATGKTVGMLFREEIAGPLGLDFHIGLTAEHDSRVARLGRVTEGDGAERIFAAILDDPTGIVSRAFANPPSLAAESRSARSRAWRGSEMPAANGHGTARSLAKLYGVLADGGAFAGHRVLSPESIARCSMEESEGLDAVLGIKTRFSLGFMLSQPDQEDGRIGPNRRTFGHAGAGGSIGFGDPDARIGFGYAMNGLGQSILTSRRAAALIEAVYACLGA